MMRAKAMQKRSKKPAGGLLKGSMNLPPHFEIEIFEIFFILGLDKTGEK
jgi:hypothetical protein